MHEAAATQGTVEAAVGPWMRTIGVGIDIFGVVIIVLGIAWSTYRFVQRRMEESHYDAYKICHGRAPSDCASGTFIVQRTPDASKSR
jgi:hypothetical protein